MTLMKQIFKDLFLKKHCETSFNTVKHCDLFKKYFKKFFASFAIFYKKPPRPAATPPMEGNVQLTYLQANKLEIISKLANS